jgi:PAS domain S-box-containing protein
MKKFSTLIKDLFNRLKGKQRCVLFSTEYINLEVIDQYKDIFDNNFMISKTTPDGIVTFVNKKFLDNYNLKSDDIIGKTHRVIKCQDMTTKDFENMWNTINAGFIWNGVMSHKLNGEKLWNNVKIFPIIKDDKIIEFIAIRNDITEIIVLNNQLETTQEEIILTLGSIVESKDGELRDHIYRVSEYSYILAKAYGLSEKKCILIKNASPMHDVGKIGVADIILNKPSKLTEEEFEEIKKHPQIGYDFFKNSSLELLKVAATISLEHHEKYDGTGYPNGLKGEEISIEGRITAIADCFDALSIKRVYKEPWSIYEIEKLLIQDRGTHFDPNIIDLYFDNKDLFLNIMNKKDFDDLHV